MGEKEKGIISLLLENDNSNFIFDYLTPDVFESPFCKSCYEILLEEYKNKEQHDLDTLVSKLKIKYPKFLDLEIQTLLKDISSCTEVDFTNVRKSVEFLINEHNAKRIKDLIGDSRINGANVYEEINRLTLEFQKIQSPAVQGMDMSDYIREFGDVYFKPREFLNVKTGFSLLDEYLTIDGGDMVVVGARPAVGKSSFAIQMAEQIADMNKTVLYFNLEMVDNQIYERMLATETGFSLTKIKRNTGLIDEEDKIVAEAKKRIENRKIRIITGTQKASDIRMSTRQVKPDVVIIDYLQLVRSDANYSNNRYAEVGQISHDLKALAVELKIPIFVLTQLNRISKDTTEPSMNEIRESGDIEQDASIILLLWNADENDYSKKGVKIDKNRQGQLNKWTDRFIFDGNSMRFVDKEVFHEMTENEIAEIPAETILPIEESNDNIQLLEMKEKEEWNESVTETESVVENVEEESGFEPIPTDTKLPWE